MSNAIPAYRTDGSCMDLSRPDPAEIDFCEMASVLSRIARFNGRPAMAAYSVAQHSVMGAEALLAETGDGMVAALFLLHDGHEYILGDLPSPAMKFYGRAVEQFLPSGYRGKRVLARAIDKAKSAWDAAIYEAAGLPGPAAVDAAQWALVKDMDARMCDAEALALFGPRAGDLKAAPQRPPPQLKQSIRPWGPMRAEERFLELFRALIGQETLLAAQLTATHRRMDGRTLQRSTRTS